MLPGPAFGFALVAHVVVGGVQQLGTVVLLQLPDFRAVHIHIAVGDRSGDGPVFRRQAVEAVGNGGGGGGAVMNAFHQPGIPHPAHGVRRNGVSAYFIQQVSTRAGGVNQCQQAVGTVFVEEVIVKDLVLNLPGVGQQGVHLLLVEIQGVLPEVPVFDVVVQPDHFVIGLDSCDARIASEDSAIRKQQFAVVYGCIGYVAHGVGQHSIGFFVVLGLV